MPGAPRTSLALRDWPDMDKAVWAKATQTGDFLEPVGKAAHWADPTKLQVQKGYGKWLYFQNLESDTASSTPQKPSERISEVTLRAYRVGDLNLMWSGAGPLLWLRNGRVVHRAPAPHGDGAPKLTAVNRDILVSA